jgi:hypothetical protein
MPTMIRNHIDDGLRTHLLHMYREVFEPLRALTATKQTLADDEFRALLDFDATTLFLNRDSEGAVTGFAITVTDLKLIPWINPEFFGRMYPEQYASGRLVYVPFFVIDQAHQKGTTFMSVTRELANHYGPLQAVLTMDCCQHNVDVERFPSILGAVSSRYTNTETRKLDDQSFWAFELGNTTVAAGATTDSEHGTVLESTIR